MVFELRIVDELRSYLNSIDSSARGISFEPRWELYWCGFVPGEQSRSISFEFRGVRGATLVIRVRHSEQLAHEAAMLELGAAAMGPEAALISVHIEETLAQYDASIENVNYEVNLY